MDVLPCLKKTKNLKTHIVINGKNKVLTRKNQDPIVGSFEKTMDLARKFEQTQLTGPGVDERWMLVLFKCSTQINLILPGQ